MKTLYTLSKHFRHLAEQPYKQWSILQKQRYAELYGHYTTTVRENVR